MLDGKSNYGTTTIANGYESRTDFLFWGVKHVGVALLMLSLHFCWYCWFWGHPRSFGHLV